MISIKKILFPTDLSECSINAFIHAQSLARNYNAELFILHVLVIFEEDPSRSSKRLAQLEDFYQESESQANQVMKTIVPDEMKTQLKISRLITRDLTAAESILDTAKEQDVDIIIMGTHGMSGLKRFFLGSDTERVLRYAPCPIMTIRESMKRFDKVGKYQRILLPVDFSLFSEHALRYAFSLAKEHGASLDIIHIVEQHIHPAFYTSGKISVFDIVPDLTSRSIQALEDFVSEKSKYSLPVDYHVLEGAPHDEIIKFAGKHETDLIVMGTKGLSGFEHLLVGSTTEKVVRKADCPVLSIHHPEKEFIKGNNDD